MAEEKDIVEVVKDIIGTENCAICHKDVDAIQGHWVTEADSNSNSVEFHCFICDPIVDYPEADHFLTSQDGGGNGGDSGGDAGSGE